MDCCPSYQSCVQILWLLVCVVFAVPDDLQVFENCLSAIASATGPPYNGHSDLNLDAMTQRISPLSIENICKIF